MAVTQTRIGSHSSQDREKKHNKSGCCLHFYCWTLTNEDVIWKKAVTRGFFGGEGKIPIVKNFSYEPMGANLTICYRRYYVKHNRQEKNAILRMRSTTASRPPEQLSSESSDSDTEEESLFGPQPLRRSLWKEQKSQRSTAGPWGSSTNRGGESPYWRGSDRELQAFISMRDQADKATEEWEQLNFDIHTLRYVRREVRSRWRKILLQLGYQCEADALLCVNRQSRFSRDEEHLSRTTELLKQLLDHTSLFPPGTGHQNKYLYVMDRLVLLDSAEDFVRLAKEKYPKKEN